MSGCPIIEPRLSFWPVLRRGLCYGLGAIIALAAGSLLGDHQDSLTLVAVVSGPTLIIGLICAVFGPFFWWCSRGDIRRWRDWRSCTGRYDSVSMYAPTFVRLLGVCVILGPGGLLYYQLIA